MILENEVFNLESDERICLFLSLIKFKGMCFFNSSCLSTSSSSFAALSIAFLQELLRKDGSFFFLLDEMFLFVR